MSEFGLLYAIPTALQGAGSVVDIVGIPAVYNTSATPEEADFNAIRSDWRAVGGDIRAAAEAFIAEQKMRGIDLVREQKRLAGNG